MTYNALCLIKRSLVFLCLIPVMLFADDGKITEFELNQKMMSFSDNYQESISETIDSIIATDLTPAARLLYQTIKVFYTHSAISIATESESIHQLLDMMVMVRLQRLVWLKGGHPEHSTPAHAALMTKQLKKLEEQLHKTANTVFTDDDINRVMSLTETWKKENPDREYVAFVRFLNFGNSEEKAQIEKILARGGLFSSISEANREIEETRHAIDRGMFLINRMPILMEWQAELFLYRVFETSEASQILELEAALQRSVDQFTQEVSQLPNALQSILSDNTQPLAQITSDLAKASENLRAISHELSPLFAESSSGEDGVDIKQIELLFDDALATSREMVKFTENLNQLSYNEDAANHLSGLITVKLEHADTMLKEQINDFDNRLTAHREFIFNSLLMLILIVCIAFPVVFFTVFLLVRRHLIKYEKALNE